MDGIKRAYYAVQNCVAVFDNTLERIRQPVLTVSCDKSTASFVYRNGTTGQNLIVVWDNSGTPNDSFVTRPARIVVKDLTIKEPVWVDLVSGRIYEIPADRILIVGENTTFKDLPLYDAPVIIAEKNLVLK